MSYNLTHNNSRKKTMCEKQIKYNQIIKKKNQIMILNIPTQQIQKNKRIKNDILKVL